MTAGRKNTSNKIDWNTPPKYIIPIKDFFGGNIDLDPCSNDFSLVEAKVNFKLPDKNGLLEKWIGETIFVNPPYGRYKGNSLYNWLSKGLYEHRINNSQIIFLVPVATNTKHFKEIIFKYFNAICFLSDTRLKFYSNGIENKKGAPMACCLCYLGQKTDDFIEKFSEYGKTFKI
jgi:hypothetical protein